MTIYSAFSGERNAGTGYGKDDETGCGKKYGAEPEAARTENLFKVAVEF